MKREKIIELAKILKLIPTEEVIESLEKEFEEINKMLEEFKQIDVTNIEPLTRLTEVQPFSLTREDLEKENSNNKEILLKNASNKNEDYVVIERVIND
ncbi:Asp-tRNA(Asn)/Glu-tRNA(Gln) amidotransferase subunit GatC [Mesomycoplasma molare]|uniref:Aspartyl/glutamyl-tRNA amidotransferase subunit C n=1 Tax=Mesomycoplasma molare TaxID=171288 RepID=A0ABY5TVW6_9BACT|nr:aspartyl/glutamyl-tRNA amidotransferase subunit C [Mesomycoplasma molare]UWD34141.1 aspartyl/glutamyl-tRNA amidotransferase subunit C [Mesomycoplasma molare]